MKTITVAGRIKDVEFIRGTSEELLNYLKKNGFNEKDLRKAVLENAAFCLSDDYKDIIVIRNDKPENEVRQIIRNAAYFSETIVCAAILD